MAKRNRPAWNFKDLTGQKFGRYEVICRADNSRTGITRWTCLCGCGKAKLVTGSSLANGTSQSCGCLIREKHTTHGLSLTREYRIFMHMHRRCRSPLESGYENYGGRGIRVCDRWSDFANFIADMGPKPSPRHSLDRIDGDGNYCPENCRWATPREQVQNRKCTLYIEHDGRRLTLQRWSEVYGLDYEALYWRYKKAGDRPETGLFRPSGARR